MTLDRGLRSVLLGAFVLGLAVSITLAQSALLLLGVRWVHRLVIGRIDPRRLPLILPVLAWTAASLTSALASAWPLESLVSLKSLLALLAMYVVLDLLQDATGAERFLTVLLVLMAGVSVVGVLQVGLCPWLGPWEATVLRRVVRHCQRAHGFYSIFMTLAGVLTLVLLAELPRLLMGKVGRGGWRLGVWLLCTMGLAATFVRGAWLGFVGGIVVAALALPGRRLLALAGLAFLLSIVLIVPQTRDRAASLLDMQDTTANERLLMWRSGVAVASDHPVTGVGVGQLKRVYPRYAAPEVTVKSRSHLHNTPLQVLAERGVLGLAAWVWFFTAFFMRAGRALHHLAPEQRQERILIAGAMAGIAGFLISGLTEYNFGDSEVALVAYSVMALAFAAEKA